MPAPCGEDWTGRLCGLTWCALSPFFFFSNQTRPKTLSWHPLAFCMGVWCALGTHWAHIGHALGTCWAHWAHVGHIGHALGALGARWAHVGCALGVHCVHCALVGVRWMCVGRVLGIGCALCAHCTHIVHAWWALRGHGTCGGCILMHCQHVVVFF